MKTNKTLILSSALVMLLAAAAALLSQGSAAVFDTCVLVLTQAFASLHYGLMRWAYRW